MKLTITLAICLLVGTPGNKIEESKPTAVTKVVDMLKDMQNQLKAEADGDEEAYDKMQCYCRTNEAEKSKAIADANTNIASLSHMIEEMTAKSSTLTSEIEVLNKEIKENQEGLAKSTEIRATDKKAFNEDEKNMITSISGLKTAVMVLGQANEYSMSQESLLSLRTSLKKVSKKKISEMLNQKQLNSVNSIVEPKQVSFLQTAAKVSAPQSGEIFGILKQMKESFEENLATSTKEEAQAKKDFEALKSSKNEEISAAQTMVETKTGENADAEESAATGKQDLADTQATLAADTEFLANLQDMCSNLDKEFAERQNTRSQEVAAVSEAIGILTDDDAHDLFNKSLGFIQLSMRTRRMSAKALAAKGMLAAAKKARDPALALLAVSMREDPFVMVKGKVQAMIDDLKAQKREEVKTKDDCNTNLYENGVATTAKEREKADLENTIANLEVAKTNLADEIAVLKSETKSAQVDVKAASENREEENREFQTTIAEQRATQQILTKALDRLKEFYAKKALIQLRKQNPGSFAPYKKNEAAGGVLAMIENVIDDSKALEQEAIKGEQDAQTAYETFVNDSTASLEAMAKEISQKTEESGRTDEALVTAKANHKGAGSDLESLEAINKQLHWDCDFMLKNFDVRQEALDQEAEALQSSIAMLSGADFR